MKKLILGLLSISIFSLYAEVNEQTVEWTLPIQNNTGKTITVRAFKFLPLIPEKRPRLDHNPTTTTTIKSNNIGSIKFIGACGHFTITKHNYFMPNKVKAFTIKLKNTLPEMLIKIDQNLEVKDYNHKVYSKISSPPTHLNIDWSKKELAGLYLDCD